MEYINPLESLKINEHILIASDCWPKNYGRTIEDINIIKKFYNDSYNLFHEKIIDVLNKFHPASWIRIAYIQLELWTVNFLQAKNEDKNFKEIPYLFIPIGRYGWRYIIEISLEKNHYEENLQSTKIPNDDEINLIFTYLVGMSYCNELSNYIHYFDKHFEGTLLEFHSNIYTSYPKINKETEKFLTEIFDYINVKKIDTDFNYFENEYLIEQINNFLEQEFQFNFNDIETIINCLRDDISVSINASNLITAYPELIILLYEKTKLNIKKIKNIVDFIYLDISVYKYERRDFLRRAQVMRMLNFAGCSFRLEKEKLETIYTPQSASWSHIKKHNQHTIISFIILGEWKINFISKFLYGQRTDLKDINKDINNSISKIEHNFNRNFFEKIILKLFNDINITCKSVDEYKKEKLSCGEIDGIAIDEKNKKIFIIEAKNLSPARDARAFGKNISDHYKQKKYHEKFLKKIEWVENNIDKILEIFNVKKVDKYIVEPYFVTASPYILKFIEFSYPILTYKEFKTLIYGKYNVRRT